MLQARRPDMARAPAVLATMHGKERVIAPILREGLGLELEVATGLDTDRFGTFTRDIDRPGSQLQAARQKARAGLARMSAATIGIASEGAFFQHPQIPLVPVGREIIVFIDQVNGLELIGQDETVDTNFGHVTASSVDAALDFARLSGFPAHGIVVMGHGNGGPAPQALLSKDLTDEAALVQAVERAIRLCGMAHVETDMRAHRNPTRMAAIARAAQDLVRRFTSCCPRCDRPGFDTVEAVPGLPCRDCGQPTRHARASRMRCDGCGHAVVKFNAALPFAEPAVCDFCNP